MRSDIEFPGDDGVALRGWLFEPAGVARPNVIVMAHGFTGVKEMGLGEYAEDWAARGLAVVAFDYEGFGASGGATRQEVDPPKQARAFSHAITWVRSQPRLGDRIGVWGSSFGGGHAITVAANDERVACAVAQVPGIGFLETPPLPTAWQKRVDADLAARAAGQPRVMIPVVSEDPKQFAVITGDERAYRYFIKTRDTVAPAWRNEVTAASLRMMVEYAPIRDAKRVKVPVFVITASRDVLTPPESARFLASELGGPVELLELQCSHFEVYGKFRAEGSAAAGAFFAKHLAV